jgi:hypothetical protein
MHGQKSLDRATHWPALGVETFSFLPQGQGNRRDLARQGEARQLRLRPLGYSCGIEIFERSGVGEGAGGRVLQPVHHPRRVAHQGAIIAGQLFQRRTQRVAVIHQFQRAPGQFFGQKFADYARDRVK